MGSKSTKSNSELSDDNPRRVSGHLVDYLSSNLRISTKAAPPPPPPTFQASGGSTYSPGNGYKYHKFSEPNSDNFVVSSLSPSAPDNKIEILIVAGGGTNSGGSYRGGCGAGGVVHSTNITIPDVGTYPIGVGAKGGTDPAPQNGSDSTFAGHPIGTITAKGGGGGGVHGVSDGKDGGSGGGKQNSSENSGTGIQPAQNPAWTPQPGFNQYGNPGGGGGTTGAYQAPGGGGAGEVGGSAPGTQSSNQTGGYGGRGQPIPGFEYPLIGMSPVVGTANANSPSNNHYGGGGMGWGYALHPDPARMKAYGGGGTNGQGAAVPIGPKNGTDGLGGGGGAPGGYGGDGMVVIRYQV